jgi:proteasome lid subunit RPN8/RPN11
VIAAESYPLEGCGILLGHLGAGADDEASIVEAIAGRNLVTDRAHDRYELDPGDIVAAERRAREHHIDIVGFWHTHPDHPSVPSRFDAERAWSGYVYVVVATVREGVVDMRFWHLDEKRGEFEELDVSIAR